MPKNYQKYSSEYNGYRSGKINLTKAKNTIDKNIAQDFGHVQNMKFNLFT